MNDIIDINIEGIQKITTELIVMDNHISVSSDQTLVTNEVDVNVSLETNNIDINVVSSPVINEISIIKEEYPLDVEVNLIHQEDVYELTFETLSISGSVSQVLNNRLVKLPDGLYVPELTLDLVSIYENAKL